MYIVFTYFVYKRNRQSALYVSMWAVYTIIAALGYFSVINGTYYDCFGFYNPDVLSLTPFILALLGYAIFFLPLKSLTADNIETYEIVDNKNIRQFINVWIVIYVLYTILKVSEAYITVSTGLADAYESRHVDGEALFQYGFFLAKFNGYGFFFLNATTPFIMTYAIYQSHLKVISEGKAIFLVFLCFFPTFCSAIGQGSRGAIFMQFFCLMFFVVLLKDFLSSNLKKKFIGAIGLVGAAALFYSLMITFDRVGEGREGFTSIERYFGESFPNLGWRYWGEVSVHPYGKRLFPDLVSYHENFASTSDSYEYWSGITNVDVSNFKTLFGDLYIEFGAVGAFIFIVSFIFLLRWIMRKNGKVTILTLNYAYFYFQICVYGFAGFTKGGHNATFSIVIIILTNALLSYLMFNKVKLK